MFNRLRVSENVYKSILQYHIFNEYCIRYCTFHASVVKSQMRMLKLPKVRAVFDRKKKSSTITTGMVEIEITFNRTQRKTLSSGVELYSNQWEDGVVVRHAESKKLNKQITELIKKYEGIARSILQEGEEVTYQTFSAALERKSGKYGTDFIDFCYDVMDRRGLRASTLRAHKCTLETLRESKIIRTFDDLTPENIKKFDTWLRKQDSDREQPTIYNYHKRLKPYINEAVSLGIIEESPYLRFKAERGKHKPKEALNEEELAAVRSLELSDESLSKARDLFVFCCYTGLAHADMDAFDFSRDVVTVHGCNYIDKQRVKTGTKYYTPILPPAMAVLEKYHYQLPRFTQQAYNRLLKCIGSLIGTKKNLSSHIARYTFATTVLLAHEVPIESVSKMMGHTRIQITQVYAKILNSSIEKQAERLANIL